MSDGNHNGKGQGSSTPWDGSDRGPGQTHRPTAKSALVTLPTGPEARQMLQGLPFRPVLCTRMCTRAPGP